MSEKKTTTAATTARKAKTTTASKPKPAQKPAPKKGLLARVYDKAQKLIVTVKSTKSGRAVIRIAKGSAVGLGLYGAYRAGKRSVRPTVVTVTPIEQEPVEEETEAPVEEEPAEETTETEHD